ncbi:MAG: hypothetical protein DHS80DRAFT_24553 [Piptocephalis tieghemiana]|nr:MAG: hypothetical protein DHS80DRAFT_24553 [Piptocephalis tieghemiana]
MPFISSGLSSSLSSSSAIQFPGSAVYSSPGIQVNDLASLAGFSQPYADMDTMSEIINLPMMEHEKKFNQEEIGRLNPLFSTLDKLISADKSKANAGQKDLTHHLGRIYPALFYLVGLSDANLYTNMDDYDPRYQIRKALSQALLTAKPSCKEIINPGTQLKESVLERACATASIHHSKENPMIALKAFAKKGPLQFLSSADIQDIPRPILDRMIYRTWLKYSKELSIAESKKQSPFVLYRRSISVLLLHLVDRNRGGSPILPASLTTFFSSTMDALRLIRSAAPRKNQGSAAWALVPGLLDAYAAKLALTNPPSARSVSTTLSPTRYIMPLTVTGNFHRGIGHRLTTPVKRPVTPIELRFRLEGVCGARKSVLSKFKKNPQTFNRLLQSYFGFCNDLKIISHNPATFYIRARSTKKVAATAGARKAKLMLSSWVLKLRLLAQVYHHRSFLLKREIWDDKHARDWLKKARVAIANFGSAAFVTSSRYLSLDDEEDIEMSYLDDLAFFLDHHASPYSIPRHSDNLDVLDNVDALSGITSVSSRRFPSRSSRASRRAGSRSQFRSTRRHPTSKEDVQNTLNDSLNWILNPSFGSRDAHLFEQFHRTIQSGLAH